MRISVINANQNFNGKIGISKGKNKLRKGVDYIANEAKQVVNKIPHKVRQIALPTLIGISAFAGGMAMPNKAQAQSEDTTPITFYDRNIAKNSSESQKTFDDWYNSKCYEGTFDIKAISKDGTLASAYRELAKNTIQEVDKDNDGKMNYGEYVEHVKSEFEARKLVEGQPYPADKEQLASSKQVKNEFSCFDLNDDKYIDNDEFAAFIAFRDQVDNQNKIFDGNISVCSVNICAFVTEKASNLYNNFKGSLNIIKDFINSPSRDNYSHEKGKAMWDQFHNPETCQENMKRGW